MTNNRKKDYGHQIKGIGHFYLLLAVKTVIGTLLKTLMIVVIEYIKDTISNTGICFPLN